MSRMQFTRVYTGPFSPGGHSLPGVRAEGCVRRLVLSLAFTIMAAFMLLSPCVWAELPAGPFSSYVLDIRRQQVPAPVPFLTEKVLDGETLGVGPFTAPEDLFLDKEGYVYVVDKGNNRVVKMTQDGKVVLQFGARPEDSGFLFGGSEEPPEKNPYLNQPSGIFVADDGTMYVADTENARIAIYDRKGNFIRAIMAPQSPLLGKDFKFRPAKLVVDMAGLLYVINSGDYRGLMQITSMGEFLGWYAPNRLPFDPGRVIVRIFATADQMAQLAKPLPPPHANVYLDDKGFLWTVSVFESGQQIKRLVAGGKNVYPSGFYGQIIWRGWQRIMPRLVDVTTDDRGVVTVVDQATSLIYQYNLEGDLLLIFGGQGLQRGLFRSPASVIVDSKYRLWVLDMGTGMIQILRPTEFASLVYKANEFYIQGRYEEAESAWKEILSLHTSYRLARRGLGMAYLKQERWKDAMQQFYLGRYRTEYSRAFGEYRREYAREHFVLVFFGIILACVLFYGLFAAGRAVVRRAMVQGGV